MQKANLNFENKMKPFQHFMQETSYDIITSAQIQRNSKYLPNMHTMALKKWEVRKYEQSMCNHALGKIKLIVFVPKVMVSKI